MATAVALLCSLGACSDDRSGPPTLTWLVTPSQVDASAVADTCVADAAGSFDVDVVELPDDVDARHTELVRRLSAQNASADVLTLDTAVVAEMSTAGFLDDRSTTGWLVDPTLLWVRTVAAERAGLDLSKPVAWDDLVAGADRLGTTVQVDGAGGSGLSTWVTGLVAVAGGAVVEGEGRDATIGIDSDAGRTAASTVEFYRESQVGPGPSESAIDTFAGAGGAFLLARASALGDPAMQRVLAEITAVAHPTLVTDAPAVAPTQGLSLAVTRDSRRPALASRLIDCLTSADTQRSVMVSTGFGTTSTDLYDDREVKRDLPTAAVLAAASKVARPVPTTPYWSSIRRTIDDTWSPLSSVTSDETVRRSQAAATAVLRGELP